MTELTAAKVIGLMIEIEEKLPEGQELSISHDPNQQYGFVLELESNGNKQVLTRTPNRDSMYVFLIGMRGGLNLATKSNG